VHEALVKLSPGATSEPVTVLTTLMMIDLLFTFTHFDLLASSTSLVT
jgi:hypothetical protein